ncbi:MAG: hypothetical protein ABIY37_10910 [Devosia sp.]
MAADVPTLKPAMSPKEIACLQKYLAGAASYVEFGCGGSTLLAVRSPAKRVWSVESDPAWMALIRRHPEITAAEQAGRLTLWHGDIGPTKAYGYPATPWWRLRRPGHRNKWPNYYETIWTQAGTAEADLFLIDGRFRVASGLAVAANCRDEAVVLVHDFRSRPDYNALLEVYEKIDRVRSLIVLKRKPGVSADRIAGLLEDFRNKRD